MLEFCCSKCKRVLPENSFSKDSSRSRGYNYKCKDCEQERNKEYLIMYQFGISLKEYELMLNEQGGGCAICGNEVGHISKLGKDARLAIDHCHKTGKIRGLLCNNCNRGLGNFQDNIILLQKAVNYLQKNKGL